MAPEDNPEDDVQPTREEWDAYEAARAAGGVNGRSCPECPFRRDVSPDICTKFNADPAAFIGQVHGPFNLPCHRSEDFRADPRDMSLRPCAGARAFRANVAPVLLHCPAQFIGSSDPVTYFSSDAEFLAHHTGSTFREAALWLMIYPPELLLRIEMERPGVRAFLPPSE